MARRGRSQRMPVKHWTFAGLILTYECNAWCASCYLKCGPHRRGQMGVAQALDYWRQLIEASPHGCRVHLTGGEPFCDWPRLLEICTRACQVGLGPLESVETNAFWAEDATVVHDRLVALDGAGLRRLVISADPYHQQFVPIDHCRRAAKVAEEVLGADRVRVRWRDWLLAGSDIGRLSPRRRRELFTGYAQSGRDRLAGRAAETLADDLSGLAFEAFAGRGCWERLLRGRHVHVDAEGWVMPGTCAGIVLGKVGLHTVVEIWSGLEADHTRRPVVGVLARLGPHGLAEWARESGFGPRRSYASRCHLCWDVRCHLVRAGIAADELAPAWLYETEALDPAGDQGGGGRAQQEKNGLP